MSRSAGRWIFSRPTLFRNQKLHSLSRAIDNLHRCSRRVPHTLEGAPFIAHFAIEWGNDAGDSSLRNSLIRQRANRRPKMHKRRFDAFFMGVEQTLNVSDIQLTRVDQGRFQRSQAGPDRREAIHNFQQDRFHPKDNIRNVPERWLEGPIRTSRSLRGSVLALSECGESKRGISES